MDNTSRTDTWYLFDYGRVISTDPEPGDWDALEAAAGLALRHPESPYWSHRDGFDDGRLDAAGYWSQVLGRAAGAAEVERLEVLDAAGWAHLNGTTLTAIEALKADGAKLALLSNMPAPMSHRYEAEAAWPGHFSRLFFSGRLGLAKPQPEIFDAVAAGLGARPRDIVFVDDVAQNIAAASARGFRTVHFGPDTQLLAELAAVAP